MARVAMHAQATGDGVIPLLTISHQQLVATENPTYDTAAALAAALADDQAYFDSTIPASSAIFPPFQPPTDQPPRLRAGWTAQPELESLTEDDVGEPASEVIVSPRFPVAAGTSFSDTSNRCWIGASPDDRVGLEFNFTSGVIPENVILRLDAFGMLGRRVLGFSCDVWFESGYDWGDPAVSHGGKHGFGLWGGGIANASGNVPPEQQDGWSVRQIWGPGTVISPARYGAIGRIYDYSFNRHVPRVSGTMPGKSAGRFIWPRGRHVPVDYYFVANRAGYADGLAQMWVDGTLVAEERRAIFGLDGTWGCRGFYCSERWQDAPPPQTQRYWVSNLNYWLPPGGYDPYGGNAVTESMFFCANHQKINSRGNVFEPLAFDIILPAEDDQATPVARLVMDNVDRRLMRWLRSLKPFIMATVELVKISDLDYVEQTWPRLMLTEAVSPDPFSWEGRLERPDYSLQRYPRNHYVESLYPALARSV